MHLFPCIFLHFEILLLHKFNFSVQLFLHNLLVAALKVFEHVQALSELKITPVEFENLKHRDKVLFYFTCLLLYYYYSTPLIRSTNASSAWTRKSHASFSLACIFVFVMVAVPTSGYSLIIAKAWPKQC